MANIARKCKAGRAKPFAMLLARRSLLAAAGALPLTRAARGQVAHRLTVLHVNDFHSRHAPVNGRALTCAPGMDAPGTDACFGGSPRLAAAIREQRAAAEADGRAVLLLDAGDQFQGSLFYTAHHGLAELAVQHAVGTDAMAVGNHEFDNGPETLARYVAAARFPVLSANIDASADPHLAGLLRPFAVFGRAGLRVGVVGLTTAETRTSSSPGPHVRFTDPRAALAESAAAARAQGARFVIALSHLGLPMDLALGVPGVGLVVGGHTHTLLSNTEAGALGPHPTQAPGGALVVQAGAYGRYLGRLDLDMADDGTVLAYGGACRHVGMSQAEDPEVAAIVARYAAPIEALRNEPVATLAAPLDIAACRVAPCRIGRIAAEALRTAAHGASVGLMNAGGLRVGLPAGPVSLGQVLDTMPFGNTLATLTLTGADLEAAVRHGRGLIGRGGFPQWAGLRAGPASTEIEDPAGQWRPLDPAARYLVATNNFLRQGGDGYLVLRDNAQDPYDGGPGVADLFADALARGAAANAP